MPTLRATEQQNFTLENFEGPLDLLTYLIQKHELDIYDIPLRRLTAQYLESELALDTGCEFVGSAAHLLWLKSKTLLPPEEQIITAEEQEWDPRFEIIHQLLDYCRFKDAAKDLAHLEEQQSTYFPRGIATTPIPTRPLGIEHLTLDDLSTVFQEILSKASAFGTVEEEEWRVFDKVKAIRKQIKEGSIPFHALFSSVKSRGELIVTFLAILELMKLGEIKVIKETATQQIEVIPAGRV